MLLLLSFKWINLYELAQKIYELQCNLFIYLLTMDIRSYCMEITYAATMLWYRFCCIKIVISGLTFKPLLLPCSTLTYPIQQELWGLKKSFYNKLLYFLLTLQFAATSFPSHGLPPGLDVSYISVFPEWLFLGLRSRGWNKADPVFKAKGSPKPEPEGSPPSPGLTGAISDKGAVCYEVVREEKKKKHNREGYLVFLWPFKPFEMKTLSIFTKEDQFSREHRHGLQSSAEILIRDKSLYISWGAQNTAAIL